MPITLNGTTGITSPGGDTSTSLTTSGLTIGTTPIGAGDSTRFKNRIINGDMRIDQRNAGASVTPASSAYLVDRWQIGMSQASKFTAQQNAGAVTPPAGYINYLGFTVASAVTVGAGDYFYLTQYIEGYNIADLSWGTANAKTITISFWVRSSLTGTFGGGLINSAFNRGYPFTYTISSANTWEQKNITIAGDTSGTWLTNNGAGIQVVLGLGVGTSNSGTAGSWSGTGYLSATGAVSVVGTAGATFYITGVQLEVGSSATGFEYVDYGTQLSMCYRYFRQYSSSGNTNSSTPMIGTGLVPTGGTLIYRMGWTMDIAMRASPSITFSGVACWAGSNVPSASTSTNYSGTQYVDIDVSTSGLTVSSNGCVGKLYFPNTSAYIQVSSEL